MRRLIGIEDKSTLFTYAWVELFVIELRFLTDSSHLEKKIYWKDIVNQIEKEAYKNIPKNYIISFKLYNKIIKYSFILKSISLFYDTLKEFRLPNIIDVDELIELQSSTVFTDVVKKREKNIEVMSVKEKEELYLSKKDEYFNKEIVKSYGIQEWFRELTKKNELEYKKEYDSLKDKYNLISETYIIEYINNYIKRVN